MLMPRITTTASVMGGRGFSTIICVPIVLMLATCVLSQGAHLDHDGVNVLGDKDRMSELLGQLASITDRLTSIDHRINSLSQRFDQRLTMLDQRVENHVSDLKDRVDNLRADLSSGASRVMQDLRAVCAELPDGNDKVTSPGDEVEKPTTPKQPDIPFNIARVEKMETADSYIVKVMYEGTTEPAVFAGKKLLQLPMNDEPGIAEFSILKSSPDEGGHAFFLSPDYAVTISFKLENTPNHMDVPRLDFKAQHNDTDLTYHAGEDVVFDFVFNIEGDVGNFDDEYFDHYILVQSDSEENVINRYKSQAQGDSPDPVPVRLDDVEHGGSKGQRHAKFILNSTIENVEGVVEASLYLRFNCSRNCLVHFLHETIIVKFYQDNHDSPFPEGFIGFIHDYGKPNNNAIYCQVGSSYCFVICHAMGDGLRSVEISKITSSGNQPISPTSLVYDIFGSSWLSFPNVSLEDAGDFRCTARSQTREITEQLTLVVVQD